MATATRVESLDEAIDMQIGLGFDDPLEIADAVLRCHGKDEVREWIDPRPLVMDVARHRLALLRRANEAQALREPSRAAQVNRMRDGRFSVWVEGKGSVRVDRLTAHDCMVRVEHLRKLEGEIATKASLYESLAAAIRAAGVETLGELPEQTQIRFDGQLVELGEAA